MDTWITSPTGTVTLSFTLLNSEGAFDPAMLTREISIPVTTSAAPAGLELEYSVTIDILEKVHEFLVHCKTRAKIPGHVGRSWRWVHVLMFLLSRVVALHAPVPKKSIRTVGGRRSYVAAVRHSERALVPAGYYTCFRSGALR